MPRRCQLTEPPPDGWTGCPLDNKVLARSNGLAASSLAPTGTAHELGINTIWHGRRETRKMSIVVVVCLVGRPDDVPRLSAVFARRLAGPVSEALRLTNLRLMKSLSRVRCACLLGELGETKLPSQDQWLERGGGAPLLRRRLMVIRPPGRSPGEPDQCMGCSRCSCWTTTEFMLD